MGIALVTGAAGFIGRRLVVALLADGHHVVGVDKETYAARPDLLPASSGRFKYVVQAVDGLEHFHGAEVVFHLAAESHVDNSISDSAKFLDTNVLGTYHLLELLRGRRAHDRPVLIHVSTDEVYGDVPQGFTSREDDKLCPSSPYAASKAAADMLVLAWGRTYGIRARIVRPSNCYGPNQYPEKLIPKAIRYHLLGKRMTIHGDGTQTRMWLDVDDCAQAMIKVWMLGQDGEVYNVPGDTEASVRTVVEALQRHCKARTGAEGVPGNQWGCERPGGDLRYRVDGKLLFRLGWQASGSLFKDLEGIVAQELEAGVRL